MTLSSQQEWFIDNSGDILEWPSQAWLDTKMNSLCVNTLGNKALSDSETFLEMPENVYQPSSNMTEFERRKRWGEGWQINADVQSLNWFKGVMNCLFLLFCYLMSTYYVIKFLHQKTVRQRTFFTDGQWWLRDCGIVSTASSSIFLKILHLIVPCL